jgi:hypothetical protein
MQHGHGEMINTYVILGGQPKWTSTFGRLDVDEKTILKWISGKKCWGVWNAWM